MKNKILILGDGFIGQRLNKEFDSDISGKLLHSFNDAQKEISKFNPKTIISCIGYTGKRNVDDCELDKDGTLFANSFIPIILSEVALRKKIKFIHISSGCIYNFDYQKDSPIAETKDPDFFDLFYSRSKVYAERALTSYLDRTKNLILRIRIPLDDRPHPKNILNKITKFEKVIDAPNSITYLPDFIKALKHLMKIDAKGIYNIANKGSLRYSKLLDVYKKYVPGYDYKVMDYNKLNLIRTNLKLSTKKLENSGFKIRNINQVLEECVKNYLKY